MVERVDPARTGVKAGRAVGLLTAILAVVSLLSVQEAFVGRLRATIELTGLYPAPFGVDAERAARLYFWSYTAGVAIARYALCYVIGSLVGVVYDWLDYPPAPVLIAGVAVVGLVDGFIAAADTRSLLVGLAYVLAWLAYVPVFYWLFDPTADATPERHRRQS